MMKRESLDDDMPLCSLKDLNSYSSLSQRSWERCEFCDEIFSTRLANIKHNASHIIIPLLKLTLHQCEECLFHFTSLNDLRTHAISKSHNTSQLKTGYKDLLKSIVEKQLIVKCHDTFNISSPKRSPRNDVVTHVSPKEEISIEISSDSDKTSLILDILENNKNCREISDLNDNDFKDVSDLHELSSPIESARSRIMFEDDFDDDLFEPEEILPDNPYYPPKNTYIIGNIKNEITDDGDITNNELDSSAMGNIDNENGIDDGDITNNELNSTELNAVRSVHYNELITPVICDCRYCGRCFANRLELIKHETTHMQVTRTLPILCYVCEKYLSGNHWTLRKHIENNHPTQERKLPINKCTYCHLNYHNFQKHVSIYHLVTCKVCNRRMSMKKLKLHDCFNYEPEVNETIVKMCEICHTFTKNKLNVHYEVIGEQSEIGKRQQCDKCLAKYFEVKLVRRKVRARLEGDGEGRKRKPMSNQQRLKKMQNRLKMAKRMNKC